MQRVIQISIVCLLILTSKGVLANWDQNYCDVLNTSNVSYALSEGIEGYNKSIERFRTCKRALVFFGPQTIFLNQGLQITGAPTTATYGTTIRRCYPFDANRVPMGACPANMTDYSVTFDATYYTADNGECPIKVAPNARIEIKDIQLRVANPNKAICTLDGNAIPLNDSNHAAAWIHNVRIVGALPASPVIPPLAQADTDRDGIIDTEDNCPDVFNSTQSDLDSDDMGDVCDDDMDGDGLNNSLERQQRTDPTNPDHDGDGVLDNADDCPRNPFIQETNNLANCNAVPRVDTDGDKVPDIEDNCPNVKNPRLKNGVEEAVCQELVVTDPNCKQPDTDNDDIGDACDTNSGVVVPPNQTDIDGDGVLFFEDNCPNVANEDQADKDEDDFGDVCDLQDNRDTDEDGKFNYQDNCPEIKNADQVDADGDGQGDACDTTPDGNFPPLPDAASTGGCSLGGSNGASANFAPLLLLMSVALMRLIRRVKYLKLN